MANTAHSHKSAQRAIITAHQPSKKVLEVKVICQYNGISKKIHIIRCQEFEYTYGHFQKWLLPYSHAITAIRFAKRAVYKWVAPFWEPAYVALGTAYQQRETGNGYINNHIHTIKINNILFPHSATTSATLLPQNQKKLAQTKRRGRRRGISLRALRTNYIATHVMVELAIIEGIRSALRGGHIKSAFLIYFHLYIFLNIIFLLKLRFFKCTIQNARII
jgi:hypothetical protein